MPNEKIPTGFFRITRPYSDISGNMSKIASACSTLVAYEHECDDNVARTHTHVYFTGYTATRDTLKKLIRENHPAIKGNKDLSIKAANMGDQAKIICYMSKGKLEPKFYRGIDWLTIQNYTKEWKALEQPKNLKNKAEMLKAMNQIIHNGEYDARMRDDPDELYEVVITVIKQRSEPCGLFKILEYIDTLRVMNDSPRFRDMVLQKYSSRFM